MNLNDITGINFSTIFPRHFPLIIHAFKPQGLIPFQVLDFRADELATVAAALARCRGCSKDGKGPQFVS